MGKIWNGPFRNMCLPLLCSQHSLSHLTHCFFDWFVLFSTPLVGNIHARTCLEYLLLPSKCGYGATRGCEDQRRASIVCLYHCLYCLPSPISRACGNFIHILCWAVDPLLCDLGWPTGVCIGYLALRHFLIVLPVVLP